MTEWKSLAAALVKAQLAAEAVGKDKANAFHKYKYASAEAMLAEGREALASAGLALMQLGWSVSDSLGKLHVKYMLLHDSGEHLTWTTETSIIPDKGRPQDKAEAAALTYSIAYTIRGLLLLPRVDDQASVDARDDRHHEPRRAPARSVPHDDDGVVLDGPMPFTAGAPSPQIVAAIHAAAEADMPRVLAWLSANREELMPEDLELYKAELAKRAARVRAAKAKSSPREDIAPPDAEDAAARAAIASKPLTDAEKAALSAQPQREPGDDDE